MNKPEAKPKQDTQKNESQPPKKPNVFNVGEHILKQAKYFEVVLLDGQRWQCKLIDYGQFELLVETEEGKILLPKHSINYYVIEKQD